MQVPQGHQPLHSIRQGAGHGVPVLHHPIDLVDPGDGAGQEVGGSAQSGGGAPYIPHHAGAAFGGPSPPVLPLLCLLASCTVALCLAISFTFARTLWGGGSRCETPNPAVPTPNFTASARAVPWLSRDPVTPSAPFPPSVPPHLHPGLHLVQHSCVQDIDLGLQELHGLLGTESRVRGDVAAPWDCPLQVLWARGGGKGTLHAPHRSPGQG